MTDTISVVPDAPVDLLVDVPIATSSEASTVSRAERSERTRDLFERLVASDDELQRDSLVEQIVVLNLRIAHAVAGRYARRGVDREDLEQVASQGLVKAIQKFDPAMGKDFLTYAVPTIRGEVQRYFRDSSWTVRPPRPVQELQWRVNQAVDRLSSDLGREPTEREVIADLEITYEEYAQAITAFGCFTPTSLDQPTTDSGTLSIGDGIADESTDAQALEAKLVLEPALRTLSDEERRILHLRFAEDRTQQEIGAELGVTQVQVSRLLSRTLRKLRAQLGDHTLIAG